MNTYYVDGEFLSEAEAKIPIDDLAILRGYGIFDYLRTYGGKPVFLPQHIERLQKSASKIGLDIPWSQKELIEIVKHTLNRNRNEESSIRLVVTGGSSPDFITPQGKPRLLVFVTPYGKVPDHLKHQGVKIITMRFSRNIASAKSIDYIQAILAQKKGREQGAVEVVYIDPQNHVLEGTISNIFAFLGDRLVTPDGDILCGITRKMVLELAADKYDVAVRDLSLDELKAANEVFITGSNKGILPVIQVDHEQIGSGQPGNRTRLMMDDFIKYAFALAESMEL